MNNAGCAVSVAFGVIGPPAQQRVTDSDVSGTRQLIDTSNEDLVRLRALRAHGPSEMGSCHDSQVDDGQAGMWTSVAPLIFPTQTETGLLSETNPLLQHCQVNSD